MGGWVGGTLTLDVANAGVRAAFRQEAHHVQETVAGSVVHGTPVFVGVGWLGWIELDYWVGGWVGGRSIGHGPAVDVDGVQRRAVVNEPFGNVLLSNRWVGVGGWVGGWVGGNMRERERRMDGWRWTYRVPPQRAHHQGGAADHVRRVDEGWVFFQET